MINEPLKKSETRIATKAGFSKKIIVNFFIFLIFGLINQSILANQSVLEFCQYFAKATPDHLITDKSAIYVKDSATIEQSYTDDIIAWVGNIFQPQDSKFIDSWRCYFQIKQAKKTCQAVVKLPIAEYEEFANYTSWKELSFITNNRVYHHNRLLGFVTPKYFELNCEN